jgi:hypothetical protein
MSRRMLEGHGWVVSIDDPLADRRAGDPRGRRYTALVMAGGTGASGDGWLVEVYVDDIAGDVTSLAGALRALAACALLPPRSSSNRWR